MGTYRTLAAASILATAMLGGAVSVEEVSGQELATGTWTGTITDPGGDVIDVTYELSMVDGALEGRVIPPTEVGMPPLPMSNISVDGGVLTFSWSPGTALECELEQEEDGSYVGPCIDGAGDMGFMIMEPPKE